MEKTFYNIFKTFFKVGTLLLGGGYVILPLLKCEIVDKKQWLTFDELCEYYALAQSVPGLIAANLAIFAGCKLLGQKGAFAAIAGIVTPAFLSIILVAKIIQELIGLKFIQSIFWGVAIGVIVLIMMAVREMYKKSVIDKFTMVIFISSIIFSVFFNVSPGIIILISAFAGIIYKCVFKKDKDTAR